MLEEEGNTNRERKILPPRESQPDFLRLVKVRCKVGEEGFPWEGRRVGESR